MKFPFSVVVALFVTTFALAQEKCATPSDETVNDLNSISITKCSIDDVKNALENEDSKLSTRKRHRKVRQNNISIDATNKVENVKENSLLVQKLNIKNDVVSSLKKVPFHLVEQIPLFKKCKNEPLLKQSKCFEKNMVKHIVNNFSYPKKAFAKGIEGKILVQFTINKEGDVIDIKKRGPEGSELLKAEADRLITKLPKFIPGKHNGELVNVKYALPIIFKTPKKS